MTSMYQMLILVSLNPIESRLEAGPMTLLGHHGHSATIVASRSNEVSNLLGVF